MKPVLRAASPTAKNAPLLITMGDAVGIGPEIMQASLNVLLAAGANIAIEPVEIGERVYRRGHSAGIGPEAWESLRRTKIFYKAPITTPQGGGFKSFGGSVEGGGCGIRRSGPGGQNLPPSPVRHRVSEVIVLE